MHTQCLGVGICRTPRNDVLATAPTLFAYLTVFGRKFTQLKEFNAVLPDDPKVWVVLRRSGIAGEQRTMIVDSIGKDLNLGCVTSALYITFGQDLFSNCNFEHGPTSIADDDGVGDVLNHDDYDDTHYDEGGLHDESDTFDAEPDGYD